MAPIPYFNKVQIISLFQDGLSHSKISERLGIGRSTISAIIKKWRQDQTVERRPGSGGRRISTRNEDEQLLTVIRNSPFTTATAAVNISNFPGSVRTSRRRLRNSELRNHAAARKIRLTPQHKEARVGFALEHLAKDNAFWSRVVFSDEKVFQSAHNGRVRVYRPRNSRYDERYVEPTERSGRFSVNVWGWISAVSPGVMLHVEERLNSGVYIRILENVMRPSVTRVYPNQNFIFQQDNCSVHTSHRVATWFQDQNINVLDWPSRSPDVNPIENMWGFLVRHLQKQRQIYRNRQELLTAITDAWHALPQDYIRNLCLSMPNRLRKVLDANGAVTKY
jgi:transposase